MRPKYQFKIDHGVTWLLVFYHNASNDIIFTSSDEARNCNNEEKFSILNEIDNRMRIDNAYEFLLEYPKDYPGQYNRWTQNWNPLESNTRNEEGFHFIHLGWENYLFEGLALSCTSTSSCCTTLLDGTSDETWWYSIGMCSFCDTNYGLKKPPGPNSQAANEIVLWLRIRKNCKCSCNLYSNKGPLILCFIFLIK